MNITAKVNRYNPEGDETPPWEPYEVDAEPTDATLRVLLNIK